MPVLTVIPMHERDRDPGEFDIGRRTESKEPLMPRATLIDEMHVIFKPRKFHKTDDIPTDAFLYTVAAVEIPGRTLP